MSRAFPFHDFLELLRARGYPVEVRDHLALARLLTQFDSTNPVVLRDAMASLIARTPEEVDGISRLFDEVYAPTPPEEPPGGQAGPADVTRRGVPAWVWPAMTAAGAVLLLVVTLAPGAGEYPLLPAPPRLALLEPLRPIPIPDAAVPPRPAPQPEAPVRVPPPTPPDLPRPPSIVIRSVLLQAAAAALLLLIAWFWHAKHRVLDRQWRHDAWRAALGSLPGPFRFQFLVKDLSHRLPRFDIEDAAGLLGRIFGETLRGRSVDVRKTLRSTLRHGLYPHVIYKPVRASRHIVVLHDTNFDMDVWSEKVEAFLADLKRQGIALERWFFEGDLRLVSAKPRGSQITLTALLDRGTDAPLLVVSAGGGLAATASADWMRALTRCSRRTWLNPVSDPQLWPPELERLPINVWPMNRSGLIQAARELSGLDRAEVPPRREPARPVTRGDVERLKQLASIVPSPTVPLVEFLRQRFAADIPEAALAHLLRETGSDGLRRIHLSDDEIARHLRALRSDSPALERAIRTQMLAVLRDSTPSPDSAAYLRWNLAVAVQQLALAQIENADTGASAAELARLADGPLWEEVADAVKTIPGVAEGKASIMPPAVNRAGLGKAPRDDGTLARHVKRPRTWPGVRELAPAAAAAAVICAVGWALGLFPERTIAHVENAYQLELADENTAGGVTLNARASGASQPQLVDLHRDGVPFRTQLRVRADQSVPLTLTAAERGSHYQLRAPLPSNNLAVSNSVWVPAADTIVVLVDAQPWARVSIEGNDASGAPIRLPARVTPFRAALPPGAYTFRLENGGLTPELTEQRNVTAGTSVIRFQMPGFNPNSTAATLVP